MQFNKSLPCVVHYLPQASSATHEHMFDLIKDTSTKFSY